MVRVVTDSVADLPSRVAAELGITVVPLIVRFGTEEYRDGVDLSTEEFYEKLAGSSDFPVTATPSPQDFAQAYDRLAEQADGVLAVMLTSRLSGTYQVALKGRELMKRRCRVEVLDSRLATMAQGFVAMKAAEAARDGASLEEALAVARREMPRSDMLCCFDTLEYLRRGGRIGAAQAFLGSMLRIHPMIALRDGVVMPAGRTRSRAKAVDRLYEYVAGYERIDELAVEHTACPEEAEAFIERLSALYPRERIYSSKMTPVIGAHTGPGLLLVAVLGDRRTEGAGGGEGAGRG
ncbi:MAG: DegV family protein [Spirochaetales bacterium]|nr:DegV family protein [Spirochaetales bacterium]